MFTIGNNEIRPFGTPFIIGEMSGNHNQSLERALEIIDIAADAGVHALKIQTYTADTMTIDLADGDFFIADEKSLWKGESLYNLYEKAHTPWDWHKPIFDRCRERGIIGFSTPFDATAVDFLMSLDVPCFKIASFEIVDLPLIAKVAATGKPMIISTGMASVAEIDEAVRTARANGCRDLIVLKCTSTYPASAADSHLATIPHMRELFDCEVGLSDHTMGIGAAVAASALGAVAIEKHITTKRADGGVDSAFSLEPDELAALVRETATAAQAVGHIRYGVGESECASLVFRRSLYIIEDVKAGERLTPNNLRAIRPGFGLSPKYVEQLMGRAVGTDIARGTPMRWDFLA